MLAEVVRFSKWLLRRSPHATTTTHYTNDLELFLTWANRPFTAITLHDIDAYIEHAQSLGHASATINRRLAASNQLDWLQDHAAPFFVHD